MSDRPMVMNSDKSIAVHTVCQQGLDARERRTENWHGIRYKEIRLRRASSGYYHKLDVDKIPGRKKRIRKASCFLCRVQTYPSSVWDTIRTTAQSIQPSWEKRDTYYSRHFKNLLPINRRTIVCYAIAIFLSAKSFAAIRQRWYHWQRFHYYLHPDHGFHPQWHPTARNERFPTVDERVQLYMSNWYLPPCHSSEATDERVHFTYEQNDPNLPITVNVSHNLDAFDTFTLDNVVQPDIPFALRRDVLYACSLDNIWFTIHQLSSSIAGKGTALSHRIVDREGMQLYCKDALELLGLFHQIMIEPQYQLRAHASPIKDDGLQPYDTMPLLAQFGDEPTSHLQHIKVPYFKKFRRAVSRSELNHVVSAPKDQELLETEGRGCVLKRPTLFGNEDSPVYAPILWNLKSSRHFGRLDKIPFWDIPWEEKLNKAVWRGTLTGKRAITKDDSDHANCLKMLRCRLALRYSKSASIDAGLAHKWQDFPDNVDGETIVKGYLSVREQLRYKAIIIVEGNDVATGLKWALLSRSVVMMPPPTVSSWAMEELLVPWVHYIPLDTDASNAEDRLSWVIANDHKARRIAERATLFMHDLVFHPDAKSDDDATKMDILRRYRLFWSQPSLN